MKLAKKLLEYTKAGLSIIPIDTGSKRPAWQLLPQVEDLITHEIKHSWSPYQEKIASREEILRWVEDTESFALVCGRVSGNLEIIDFDNKDFFDEWKVKARNVIYDYGCVVQQTGSGIQVIYRRESEPHGNQKLAWFPDEKAAQGRSVAIETRGEGGYALVAPSLHPSGKRYKILYGDLTDLYPIPDLIADAFLHESEKLCKALLSMNDQNNLIRNYNQFQRMRKEALGGRSDSVIDRFNKTYTITDMLEATGHTRSQGGRWSRPGKPDSGGVWVTGDLSYHHSSNDPLNDGHAHDAFDLYRVHMHNGDYTEAVKAAADQMGLNDKKGETKTEALITHIAQNPGYGNRYRH